MSDSGKDHYGIGAVARLTGLSDHTIRVWERRYGAVVAARSASGRRLYVPADVEKLRLLKLLTDRNPTEATALTSIPSRAFCEKPLFRSKLGLPVVSTAVTDVQNTNHRVINGEKYPPGRATAKEQLPDLNLECLALRGNCM